MRYILSYVLLVSSFSALADCEDLHWQISSYQRYLNFSKERGTNADLDFPSEERELMEDYERRTTGLKEPEIEREKVILEIKRRVTHRGYALYLDKRYAKPLMKFVRAGDIRAQFCASVLYEFGAGVPENRAIAYGLAATAVAQNPPFGQHRRDEIASTLSPNQQSQGMEIADRLMRTVTDLFDQPTTILIK